MLHASRAGARARAGSKPVSARALGTVAYANPVLWRMQNGAQSGHAALRGDRMRRLAIARAVRSAPGAGPRPTRSASGHLG